ncbi:MAG TPA: cysteine desulfurase [Candidatus Acidoferrales bacterium]|nr:cysteine desulfurase [Candidatus Acidoferrales bacterium]
MTFDNIKQDFPIFSYWASKGKPLIYLDSAATTQKPRCVIDALDGYYSNFNANVHRGAYELSQIATDMYEGSRTKIAGFVNAPKPESLVFTRNATESINLVAYAWGLNNLHRGDEIILTEMEHHSNLVPWHIISRHTGSILKFIRLRDDFQLDLDSLKRNLSSRTKVVSVVHISNVLGTVNPVTEITRLAHEAGAICIIDGAQGVPHMPIDVKEIDCDFYAFSGHKMCGPTGIGCLYGRHEILEKMEPFLGGGEMINEVFPATSSYAKPPHKFEAGTPNIAGAVGLKAAVEYLESVGMKNIQEHEARLGNLAVRRLSEIDGIHIHRHQENGTGVISLTIDGAHPHDISSILDSEGIAIRAGHHCAQPLMRTLHVQATARASFYVYNNESDVEALASGLEKAAAIFKPRERAHVAK